MNRSFRIDQGRGVLALALALLATGCASLPPGAGKGRGQAATRPVPVSPHYLGQEAADAALEQLGAPYRYGGAGPDGFDCSGLVQYAYRLAGKSVPRTTLQLWSHTSTVLRDELEPGDLLFFSIAGKMQHVGLYVGDDRFVHAPSSGRTVTLASLSSEYYRETFLRAGRLPQDLR